MLSLQNICCKDRKKIRLQVDVLNTSAGGLTAIIGPNGAGKTTLFNVISGELGYSGDIHFHGRCLRSWPALRRARHLAVLPQSSQLSFPFTASEVVALGLTPLTISKHEAQKAIRHYMRMSDCITLAEQPYPSLSGGERQRVQLARVLLQLSQAEEEPLLLLDEPTSAQDLGHQHQILELAQQLCQQQNYGILAILHDLNQVMRYCNHCALLNHGQLIMSGHPSLVLSEESIEKHWQYRPQRIAQSEGETIFI